MTNSKRPFAIITGASRGIGAEYARGLARQNHDLLIVARDKARLRELSQELETAHTIHAHMCVLDLAQPNSAHQLFVRAREYRQTPDLLINNAGFGLYGEFVSHPLPKIQQMLHLHIQSVVESIRLFLPGMMEQASGTIINVASIAGMLPIPYFAEYAATKAFLISFSEALAEEVKSSGVTIQACCPGQTETDFHASAGFRPSSPIPIQTASQVVQASLAAIDKKQTVVTVGWPGKLSSFLATWVPRTILTKQTARRTRPPSMT
ncbi:SDR family oxidoreductase [Candidatus Nitronereus thalassa]|uniref:SDR family oxidoreductase n=1 Tax=Candidatus Nitronereus thalassa TaxID=3020898 RepID=A0ABU3K6U1_9BACT|nr:SDR family oxidoreductase [Candidatus Nitronereus thalassa]MDT7042108.1 SDR family oxidoreductase [Candidatus Nitronereus thalassa]